MYHADCTKCMCDISHTLDTFSIELHLVDKTLKECTLPLPFGMVQNTYLFMITRQSNENQDFCLLIREIQLCSSCFLRHKLYSPDWFFLFIFHFVLFFYYLHHLLVNLMQNHRSSNSSFEIKRIFFFCSSIKDLYTIVIIESGSFTKMYSYRNRIIS